jgi:hypothetical protein
VLLARDRHLCRIARSRFAPATTRMYADPNNLLQQLPSNAGMNTELVELLKGWRSG